MRVLVVNAGSSSLKVSLVDGDQVLGQDTRLPATPPDGVAAVGHRVVHGGTRFRAPVVVDAEVERELRALVELAPLHQPPALRALDAARALLPGVPQVACFDTAFHAGLPAAAATYAVPREWRELGARRYGFHGLSHASASRRAAELVPGARRIVVCHLGAGASLAAVLDGRCVDTTMGFTPLEGLVMATRSGSVDPGLLLWAQDRLGLTPGEAGEALETRSGLLALAGTADMRALLGRRDDDAVLAVEVYLHHLVAGVAAMAAALGGLDVLVFTGGVGENAAPIRERATAALAFLGVGGPAVATLVIAAHEDLEIARGVRELLSGT